MAKVLNPLNATQASGSVEGLTYSRWHGTNTTRRRAFPTNPRTPSQLEQRATLAAVQAAWQSLKSTGGGIVQEWDDFSTGHTWNNGPFNPSQTLPSYQSYVKVNMALQAFGFPISSVPPSATAPGMTFAAPTGKEGLASVQFDGVDSMVLYAGVDGEDGGINPGWTAADSDLSTAAVQVWAERVLFPGRKPDVTKARLVRTAPFQTASNAAKLTPTLQSGVSGVSDSIFNVGEIYNFWVRVMRQTSTEPGPFHWFGTGPVLIDPA